MKFYYMYILFILLSFITCKSNNTNSEDVGVNIIESSDILTGADQMDVYLPMLQGKNVALVVNQTSMIKDQHLADVLLEEGVGLSKLFAPEHGIRGKADAGAKIEDGVDSKTGLPIISLYGKNKKPSKQDLEDVSLVVFDIQDVGARFYTYISTLHYVMEACAENNIPLIVLDRPNPNAHYVDGPVLEKEFSSFVGMHPVPVVYGLTIGEYAKMINGESWLMENLKCDLTVIPCKNYNHKMLYELPIKPSPNLPNIRSILLYPSICFFEGTHISVGRGTQTQFQVLGSPALKEKKNYQYTPVSMDGAKYPKHENLVCYGDDLSNLNISSLHQNSTLDLKYLIDYYKNYKLLNKEFFLKNNFFNKLAGNSSLQSQLKAGMSESEIRKTWEPALENYKTKVRVKYSLY